MAEHENRSSALSPEVLGAINVSISAAIREAIGALTPVLQSIAVTPEKLREANKPYVDPAKAARSERETKLWREDIEDARKQIALTQANCLHQDDNGRSSIQLVHNYPDRQPRGLCVHCHDLIHPREWRIGPPDKDNPRGRAYLVDAHPHYKTVMQLQSRS